MNKSTEEGGNAGRVLCNKDDLFANPKMARAMKPMMRIMMNGLMKVTSHNNDCTQKEVSDFMVPKSSGKPFLDKPGTFDEDMKPRIKDMPFSFPMLGMMLMHREVMEKSEAPHNKGITWEKYKEFRTYTTPGYVEKSPNVGDKAPDGKILSISGDGTSSTLLTEAKKMAAAAGSSKVILSFEGVTCPFYRSYCAEDMYKASNGVPALHVYIREAEPCDVFDAGGMHCTSPLALNRRVYEHKSEADRALVANETKAFLEEFMGKGKCNMWMDQMSDELEAKYEARPWRQYVMDVDSGKIVAKLGLAPFNMAGKLAKLKEATK